MKKIGTIKAIADRQTNFGILMEEEGKDTWFSAFGACPAPKFSKVSFDWYWDNPDTPKYRNIDIATFVVMEKGANGKPKEDAQSTLPMQSPKESLRPKVIDFMNECIQDAFDIYKSRSDAERGYMPDFMELIDQVRRTRIMMEMNREG